MVRFMAEGFLALQSLIVRTVFRSTGAATTMRQSRVRALLSVAPGVAQEREKDAPPRALHWISSREGVPQLRLCKRSSAMSLHCG
jgi:hypothetical protein